VKLLDDICALGSSTEEPKAEKETTDHDHDKHFYIEALNNTLSVCFPSHLSASSNLI
jgi:hypothetical protein